MLCYGHYADTPHEGDHMKTQISFKQTNSNDGVALIDGGITTITQAKIELAAKLDLPAVDALPGKGEDIDARLRHGGIEPTSIKFNHISE